MKKLLLICLFLWFNLTLFSQQNKIKLIPKTGCSMNSVYDPSSWTYKFSPLLFGFDSSKKFSKKIGVNAELYFIRKGTHSKKNSEGQRYQNYEFDYLIFLHNLLIPYLKNSNLMSVLALI